MKFSLPAARTAFTLLSMAFCFALSAPAWAQLRIGQPSGFSGAVSAGVKENTQGANLYIDAVNAKGGVNGQKIELISVDDKFDPKVTAEVGKDLITNKKVLALFLNRGTPHAQALLPLLEEHKIPLVAPSTGAMVLHEPVNPWVFNVRAPYRQEAAKAIGLLAVIGITRIALLPTDDTFGADAAVGALQGFETAGLKPVILEKFQRNKPDFTELAAKVAAEKAQAVMIIASATNVVNFTKVLREAGSAAQIVTLSNNASAGFIELMGDQGRGVIVSQVFPNERSNTSALIKEARTLAKAKGMDGVSPAMIEGFAAAKVLVEGLKRAGQNPTRATLRTALESMNNYSLGGLPLSYSPTNHSGLDFADLSIIDANGQFRR